MVFLLSQPTSTVPQSIPMVILFSNASYDFCVSKHTMLPVYHHVSHLWDSVLTSLGFATLNSELSVTSRKHCEGWRSYCQERTVPGEHSNPFLKRLKNTLSWLLYMLHSHYQSQLAMAGRRDWGSGEEEVGSCCPRRKEGKSWQGKTAELEGHLCV